MKLFSVLKVSKMVILTNSVLEIHQNTNFERDCLDEDHCTSYTKDLKKELMLSKKGPLATNACMHDNGVKMRNNSKFRTLTPSAFCR